MVPLFDAIEAGARVIVKRAALSVGIELPDDTPTEALKRWARSNPVPVARACRRKWEQSARAWVRGNNSGDNSIMEEESEREQLYAAQAETVAGWCGIEKVDYPGLYPVFRVNGHDEYFDNIERAFVIACATHKVTHDGREQFRGTEGDCMAWMHRNLSYSIHHATTHEGYAIVPL